MVTYDTTHLTADSTLKISGMEGSPLLDRIRSIVGRQNEFDARHIDSAYKSNADCFLTSDYDDIISNRTALEALLGIHFFHIPSEVERFHRFIMAAEQNMG